MDQEIHTKINWLDRAEMQKILEDYGFGVYGRETDDEVREALRVNIADGTIPDSVLDPETPSQRQF